MLRSSSRFVLAGCLLLMISVVIAACGSSSSSSSTGSGSGGGGKSSGTANVAAATAAVAQYTGHPSPFPVDQPLKKRPTGQTFAFLQCSTPVCGTFSQLLAPTQHLLGFKLSIFKAGASASSLQSAMSSIISSKPTAVVIPATNPEQYSNQLKQLATSKVPISSNGIMYPAAYGIEASVFDARLSTLSGKLLADWVISRHGSKSNSVFYNTPELDFSDYVESGYRQEMTRLCPSCTVRYVTIPVATVGNTAPQTVANDLQSHPDTKTVVFASEETATGLPAALKASGIHVEVTGFAPDPTVVQYIKDGQITSGLGLDLAIMIWTQTDELARLTTGQPLTAGEKAGQVPIEFLYQNNLTGNLTNGWAAYPDFPARFAKIWAGK